MIYRKMWETQPEGSLIQNWVCIASRCADEPNKIAARLRFRGPGSEMKEHLREAVPMYSVEYIQEGPDAEGGCYNMLTKEEVMDELQEVELSHLLEGDDYFNRSESTIIHSKSGSHLKLIPLGSLCFLLNE